MKIIDVLMENFYSNHNKSVSDFKQMSDEDIREYFVSLGEQRDRDPMILAVNKQRSHRIKDNSYVFAVVGKEEYDKLNDASRIRRFPNGQLTVVDESGKPYSGF